MTAIDLSRRNAHRVATVRSKANPELGELKFNYYARKQNGWQYHTVGEGEHEEVVIIANLGQYEVASFSYEKVTLDEYWNAAREAFYWNSMDPDKRQENIIKDYEQELNEDLASIPETYHDEYIAKYKQFFGAMLSSQSRVASSAVTGPAGFNHIRNEKAHNSYQKRCEEFREWRKRTLNRIAKAVDNARPAEEKDAEAWEALKARICRSVTYITEIDAGIGGGSRPLFVSNLYNKIETVARHGNVDLIDKAVALIRESNAQSKKPIFTERHKFFKLPEMARTINQKYRQEQESAADATGNKEISFDGGKVVWNYELDRLQILFDEIPDKQMRTRLGREFSFRWSPTNKAWQRQLTRNAEYAAQRALNITF